MSTKPYDLHRLEQQLRDGEASDGHHTHNELYAFRYAYNALLFNAWAASGAVPVYKSWNHSDGLPCFGGNSWFIVVAELPTGQISNHYQGRRKWASFNIPAVDLPPEYDGHSSADVMNRLRDYLALGG